MASQVLAVLAAAGVLTASVGGAAVGTRAAASLPVAVAAAAPAVKAAECRAELKTLSKSVAAGKAAACDSASLTQNANAQDNNAGGQGNGQGVGGQVAGVGAQGGSRAVLLVLAGTVGAVGLGVALSNQDRSNG